MFFSLELVLAPQAAAGKSRVDLSDELKG